MNVNYFSRKSTQVGEHLSSRGYWGICLTAVQTFVEPNMLLLFQSNPPGIVQNTIMIVRIKITILILILILLLITILLLLLLLLLLLIIIIIIIIIIILLLFLLILIRFFFFIHILMISISSLPGSQVPLPSAKNLAWPVSSSTLTGLKIVAPLGTSGPLCQL